MKPVFTLALVIILLLASSIVPASAASPLLSAAPAPDQAQIAATPPLCMDIPIGDGRIWTFCPQKPLPPKP